MCGISGILHPERPIDPGLLDRLTDRMAHRGPDGRGTLIRENLGLGHRRLSIIDPEGGAQPFSGPNGKLHITYNGEIYNFRDLRRELTGRGHAFHTECDTEVVLNSYAEWGKDCVHHFRGMFAFAIADFRKHELFLARDRFGIKPLVYLHDGKRFAFASEIQALWEIGDFAWDIDLASLDLYLQLQYIPAPRTIFRNVYKLPAGHRMVVRFDSTEPILHRWWKPEFQREKHRSAADWEARLDHALRTSVKAHLVSDVRFGAFLSGGVDSSLMVGYMAEEMGEPVKTFSIGFGSDEASELPHARRVAERYSTDHHEDLVQPDALEILPDLVRHYGEPFGDQSAVPTWYLSRLTRDSVPMAISGDGGDELFAGYGTYPVWLRKLEARRPRIHPDWKDRLYPLASRLFPGRYPPLLSVEDRTRFWLECVQRFSLRDRERLWRSEYRFVADLPAMAHLTAMRESAHHVDLRQALQTDISTFLVDDILAKVDVASMAHGLEVRPPILDPEIFALAAQMPVDILMPGGRECRGRGKHPLKAILARRFSPDFAWRSKQGFVMPLETWFQGSGHGFGAATDLILSPEAVLRDYFEPAGISRTIDSGSSTNVWLLLVLEHWLREFRGRKGGTSGAIS